MRVIRERAFWIGLILACWGMSGSARLLYSRYEAVKVLPGVGYDTCYECERNDYYLFGYCVHNHTHSDVFSHLVWPTGSSGAWDLTSWSVMRVENVCWCSRLVVLESAQLRID